MKIKVLGCGNAFSNKNFNQSFLLTESFNGATRNLLLDAGYQTHAALNYHGISVQDIDDLYLSHLHADHIGCVEYLAFARYDWLNKPERAVNFSHKQAVQLYCQKSLIQDLWEKSLRGGLESMEGFQAELDTYFVTNPVDQAGFQWQGWTCNLVQQVHIMAGSMIMPCYGLEMEKEGHKSVYFTVDTQFTQPAQMQLFYSKADLIFQDCELTPFYSNVHANYRQLTSMPEEIRKKMLLSHYQDWLTEGKKAVTYGNPDPFYAAPEKGVNFVDFDWHSEAEKDGFMGFVELGQEFQTELKSDHLAQGA